MGEREQQRPFSLSEGEKDRMRGALMPTKPDGL
jgi:hypothetical protein